MSAFIGEGTTGAADDRPLNDQEYQLLQRLLSDPFSIPQQFKTWLVSYLESSDLTLPISSVLGLKSMLGISGVGGGTLGILPAGLIFPYGGGVAPAGSKLCDGATYVRANEPRLFAAIGTAFGAPSGTTFQVPDLQGRVAVGKGQAADVDALGDSDGLAVASRNIKHRHTVGDPGHAHQIQYANRGSGAQSIPDGLNYVPGEVIDTRSASTGITVGVGSPVDAPAFLTINFIIVA